MNLQRVYGVLRILNGLEDEELAILSKSLEYICLKRIDNIDFSRHNEDADDNWITINGTHVKVNESGDVVKGPDALKKSSRKEKSGEKKSKDENNKPVKSVTPVKSSIKHKVVKGKEFKTALDDAKATQSPEKAWRVDSTHGIEDYDGHCKCYKTEKGGTFAVTDTGDIISVCSVSGSGERGRDMLAAAVEAGGTKLDSFSGNFGFYQKCGFEPVSWTPFNKEYAPSDWVEGRDAEEPVVFFKYTGNMNQTMTEKEFYMSVKPCLGEDGYDNAQKQRDDDMKRGNE